MSKNKPTKKEIKEAMEVLKLKNEREAREYFECKCPKELTSGLDGYFHRTPIDCSVDPREIINDCNNRIKYLKSRIIKITNLKNKYAKRK